MNKKDIFIGLVVGFVIGLLLIPTLGNISALQKIQALLGGSKSLLYVILLVALPIGAALGITVAGFIGRGAPVIWQIAKFGLVGVLNTALTFGVLNILIWTTGIDKGNGFAALNVIAFIIAVTNSYFWNKHWVFTGGRHQQAEQFVEFIIISVIAAGVVAGIGKVMTEYVSPIGGLDSVQWANVVTAIGVVFSMVWNFLGYKFIVFKKGS